jgi:hypothetical protein
LIPSLGRLKQRGRTIPRPIGASGFRLTHFVAGGAAMMQACNLFRRRGTEDVYCAVPEDRIVPSFLKGHLWEFAGKLDERSAWPAGFNPTAAKAGIRYNGYYVFQRVPSPREVA